MKKVFEIGLLFLIYFNFIALFWGSLEIWMVGQTQPNVIDDIVAITISLYIAFLHWRLWGVSSSAANAETDTVRRVCLSEIEKNNLRVAAVFAILVDILVKKAVVSEEEMKHLLINADIEKMCSCIYDADCDKKEK